MVNYIVQAMVLYMVYVTRYSLGAIQEPKCFGFNSLGY